MICHSHLSDDKPPLYMYIAIVIYVRPYIVHCILQAPSYMHAYTRVWLYRPNFPFNRLKIHTMHAKAFSLYLSIVCCVYVYAAGPIKASPVCAFVLPMCVVCVSATEHRQISVNMNISTVDNTEIFNWTTCSWLYCHCYCCRAVVAAVVVVTVRLPYSIVKTNIHSHTHTRIHVSKAIKISECTFRKWLPVLIIDQR